MAETKIIHATKQAEVAVTKFIESDIRNEQTSQRNIAGNSVKTSSSNTIEAPGHVVVTNSSDAGQDTMVNNNVAGNYVLLPLSNRTEAPRHVIVTISLDAGQNTVVDDNGVRQGLTDEESDTKTKLLERGVLTAASATAAMLSPFLRGVFNHHQEGLGHDSCGTLEASLIDGGIVIQMASLVLPDVSVCCVSPDEAALSILHSLKLSEESFKRVLEGSGGEDFLETLACVLRRPSYLSRMQGIHLLKSALPAMPPRG
ncbi:hypothetical protein OsI_25103 [Oryza sativa Indica Group]|uniref:Uncharacterized protein n=2 Tax=Oryza sativa TaxID=4530 RepID=A3BH49_ORYSJ|nr:hypothetical protein OsI_25103 [Oryza sativa Indica Group]EAZ38888.1 hypothetical protein OsJ_23307 [Oryza sativa Japonica Group]